MSYNLKLNGQPVTWVREVKHLGNIVTSDLTDSRDCARKRTICIGSVNKLLGSYGKIQSNVVCKLFQTYCCSFYGSELWCCNSYGFKVLTPIRTVPCTITLHGTYLIGYRHMLHLALFVRELNRWLPSLGSTLNAMAGERSRVQVPPCGMRCH